MSKNNRTLEMLQNNLNQDFAWRIKELTTIKNRIPREKKGPANAH